MAVQQFTVALSALALSVVTTCTIAAKPLAEDGPRTTVTRSPSDQVVPLSSGGSFDPGQAWNQLGCVACHGDDGPFRDKIEGALGKPVAKVARWIRNAPSIDPDTMMPSFEEKIGKHESVALASWVLRRAARQARDKSAR